MQSYRSKHQQQYGKHQYSVNVSCCNKHCYQQTMIIITVLLIPSPRILGCLAMEKPECLQKDRTKNNSPCLSSLGVSSGNREQ